MYILFTFRGKLSTYVNVVSAMYVWNQNPDGKISVST